jgi:hypothetical protein
VRSSNKGARTGSRVRVRRSPVRIEVEQTRIGRFVPIPADIEDVPPRRRVEVVEQHPARIERLAPI